MNHNIKSVITILVAFQFAFIVHAQDSIVDLSASMMDYNQAITLFSIDGWRFHEGNDPSWSRHEFNTSDWKKMKPTELNKQIADVSGRMEGWFRLQMRLDSSFVNKQLYLGNFSRGYASKIYINGTLFNSYGATGNSKAEFKEYIYQGHPDMKLINLRPNTMYTIAIHFVSYVPPSPLNLINRQEWTLLPLLSGSALIPNFYQFQYNLTIFYTVWITVSAILSLLFWILAFQNPAERNLLLFAYYSTCIFFSVFLLHLMEIGELSFKAVLIIAAFESLFTHLVIVLIPVIVAKVFINKVPRNLVYFLGAFLIIAYINRLLWNFFPVIISGVSVVIAITLYFIIKSWNRIRGAQWAIVAGVLTSLLFALLWAIITQLSTLKPLRLNIGQLSAATGIFLSFPMSLLVYVSLRFQEILKDVQEKAARVVKVTEEKRQQALNQQIVLEKRVKERTSELSQSLEDLKSTQSQLIHSEKMASLGELTAGIAHEIQNPLNFVNNFSEVNAELIEELKDAVASNKQEEIQVILQDLVENTDKINHHGKRAESIVKGMLLHSRGSSGQKELTDINALCDEYLRLSYHGFRAKDKSFSADFKLETDKLIPKIKLVPQDIGRGLLNLINNAFYIVDKKAEENHMDYRPEVVVSTSKSGDSIEIRVRDNGSGIPDEIKDKIFQPFFTTKPTGSGTGLGLSLSYDIVKAHGGKIQVDSQQGIGTTFNVIIPIQK